MARYARGVDRRDEALIRSVYHEDSIDDHGLGFSGTGYELAASVNNLPPAWENIIHLLGQHLIEVDGDEAVSEVYFSNNQIMRDDEGREWDWQTSGRYLDRWERRDGEFKIKNRRVVVDRMRTEPPAAPPCSFVLHADACRMAGQEMTGHATFLSSRYSERPYSPNSRPRPLCL
jgi:SnoaL-like domain